MNPDNPCPCDCCPGSCQKEAPVPPNTKLEPRCLPEPVCSQKACIIFGGHDTDYYPEPDLCPKSRRKRKTDNLSSLGSPVGLVRSSFAIKTSDTKGSDLNAQRFATYLKAFAKIFLTPETEWNTQSVDFVLSEGQQLYNESAQNITDEEEVESPIYSQVEQKIMRSFSIDGALFHVELCEKFTLIPSPIVAGNGDETSADPTIEYIALALKSFFRKAKYCLVSLKDWYIFVWKARGVFFVFDFYGRKLNNFVADRDAGFAMLICLKSLDNVIHLITNLSGLEKADTFSLREMKVIKLTGPDGRTQSRENGRPIDQFEIISSDYAFLKAFLHLTLNRADALRNRSALPVGVAALLTSKIDHPATWNQKVLDKIICYGVNICQACWGQCLRNNELIDLDQFPTQLKIGQFLASFLLMPRRYEGIWKCVPSYKKSDLALAIERSFEAKKNNLLVQIDHQMYAVWKKNNFIYLFDPYRHRIVGNITAENADQKSATLRIFRSLDTFLSVFNQILLETNRTTKFYIHALLVKKLELEERTEKGLPRFEIHTSDPDADVRSLNETVCFTEDETKCLETLGEISDYEEEDITSDVVQMDVKEPKSETDEDEEAMEEEEGGAEDLGDYETSSSGDGKTRKGKKKKTSRKREKDSVKGKGKKKGGKDKGDSKGKRKSKKKDDGGKKGKKKNKKKGGDDDDDGKSKKDKKKNKKKSGEDSDKDKKKKKKKGSDSEKENKDKKKKKSDDEDKAKKKKPGDKDDGTKNIEDENQKSRTFGESDGTAGLLGKGMAAGKGQMSGDKRDRDRDRDDDADDENECGDKRLSCQPNNYPGYSKIPHDMAVVGSESGTYESVCKLLRAGFKCANRILAMTPWGNYVVFRGYNMFRKIYFLFDGCTCNVNRFRHLDLNCGTAGLLCFETLHDVVRYIVDSQKIRGDLKKSRKNIVDEICRQYC